MRILEIVFLFFSIFISVILSGCGKMSYLVEDSLFSSKASSVQVSDSSDNFSENAQLCSGEMALTANSESQPAGEYILEVKPNQINCNFYFDVRGAGGGSSSLMSLGGNGGRNYFSFTPGQTGVFKIVIGAGGKSISSGMGGSGGGASSVIFDPDLRPDMEDAFTLSIAGGGGGSGSEDVAPSYNANTLPNGGNGGGDGPGGIANTSKVMVGGSGSTLPPNEFISGGLCFGLCQGGPGGGNGGFGKGGGYGGYQALGGGSGGGGLDGGASGGPQSTLQTNGSSSFYYSPGNGGSGKVFSVKPPGILTKIDSSSDPAQLDSLIFGGMGGSLKSQSKGQDGSVYILIKSI